MYELACPACNSPSKYDFSDYLLMCPFCSCTFKLEHETGQKEIFGDHFIVSNTSNPAQVKTLVLEWLKRLNHNPGATDKEYFVLNIKGLSVPFWVVSLEAHTSWKGLVQKQNRSRLDTQPGSDYLIENGIFRRNYRWAISGRHNICESWGMSRLHEPKEDIEVEWDGFPLDSTFSRGQLQENPATEKSAYEAREFFEFKFANGLPIIGTQVNEDEALRRAKSHVEQYHLALSRLNVDYLTDCRTEVEIAGVQLLHLPFWHATYVYRPRTALRHFYRPKEKNVIMEGFSNGILAGELAVRRKDKLWVNAVVCGVAAVFFLLLGAAWHPAFLLVALFGAAVAIGSAYIAAVRAAEQDAVAFKPEENPAAGKQKLAKAN
jgi:hypothetical protein